MAVLKRKVNSEAKGFSPYAGEDPRPGVYRARIIKSSIRKASTGRLSYNTLYELEAKKPDHKQYDGYTGFCEIYLGDETEEWAQAGESAFVKAITGKSNFQNVNVAYTGTEKDFETVTGAEITALDGTKVANKIVNVNLRMEKAREHEGTKYPAELRARGILPWENKAIDDEEEVDEDAYEEGEEADEIETDEAEEAETEEEMTDEEWEAAKEARRVELKSREFDLASLRQVLKDNGIETKGLKKPELVEAIIELEFPAEEDEEEEGISEDDVEPDEDETDEAESEEEEEEDEEEEPEEDEEPEADLREEIEAEAAILDRSALKKEIKKLDATAKFTTKQTDDDLRTIFVDLKVDAPGF